MKKQFITAVMILLLPMFATAGGGGAHLESANIDPGDNQSLQNGAKYYMNYCMGCHGLESSRYNRMAKDMGLPVIPANTGEKGEKADKIAAANAKLVTENLIFTTGEDGKPSPLGSLMLSSIPKKDATKWFGAPPPDLSLVAGLRRPDWIYSYLKSFYLDKKRPTGVNNTVFPNVGMPHVLWELQGWQELETTQEHGDEVKTLKLTQPGAMSAAEYDTVVRDITNFLAYVTDPGKLEREKYGIFAMILLLIFIAVAYLLKKEYWKDVH